jgi:hypothetical protein
MTEDPRLVNASRGDDDAQSTRRAATTTRSTRAI